MSHAEYFPEFPLSPSGPFATRSSFWRDNLTQFFYFITRKRGLWGQEGIRCPKVFQPKNVCFNSIITDKTKASRGGGKRCRCYGRRRAKIPIGEGICDVYLYQNKKKERTEGWGCHVRTMMNTKVDDVQT